MATRVGVDIGSIGVVIEHNTVDRKNAVIFAGVTFILGVAAGYALRGLRIAYLKKKHEYLKRQVKKTEDQLLK